MYMLLYISNALLGTNQLLNSMYS